MWVHKISQATGQSYRPVAPKTLEIGTPKTNSLTKLMGGKERSLVFCAYRSHTRCRKTNSVKLATVVRPGCDICYSF